MARFSLRTAELALLSTPRPWIIRHPVVERKARSCCPNIASTEDHRNSLPPIIQIIGVNALQPSPATDFSSSLSWKTFRSSLSPLSLSPSFFFLFFTLPFVSPREFGRGFDGLDSRRRFVTIVDTEPRWRRFAWSEKLNRWLLLFFFLDRGQADRPRFVNTAFCSFSSMEEVYFRCLMWKKERKLDKSWFLVGIICWSVKKIFFTMLTLVEMEQSYLWEEWEDIYIFQTELAWSKWTRKD